MTLFVIFLVVGARRSVLVWKMSGFLSVWMSLREKDSVAFSILTGGSCSKHRLHSLIRSSNPSLSRGTSRTDTMGRKPVCFNSSCSNLESSGMSLLARCLTDHTVSLQTAAFSSVFTVNFTKLFVISHQELLSNLGCDLIQNFDFRLIRN